MTQRRIVSETVSERLEETRCEEEASGEILRGDSDRVPGGGQASVRGRL